MRYETPTMQVIVVECDTILKDSNKHDQGVGDDRGHGYHDDWEHREFPWDNPHIW